MDGLLEGTTVVVTGGANGIGRAVARLAARHGARHVVVADLTDTPRRGEGVGDLVRAAGAEFSFVPVDVTDADQLAAAVAVAERSGGVDVMVANAGITVRGDTVDLAEDEIASLIDVNLVGVVRSAKVAAAAMVARGRGGSIVITASMGGMRGSARTVHYSATKAAVMSYAQSLAAALGPEGIRANAVCPGVIDTGFASSAPSAVAAFDALRARTPLRRSGTPDEVAGAVVWLASPMASFVTGASVVVDGGLTAII